MPILCVGETEDERDAGDTERKLRHQVQEGLEHVADERLGDVVIAYEPIWAIGTGKVADARAGAGGDRASSARWSPTARPSRPQRVRILYGGSVNADNAAELLALPDIDGALVGGASLDPASFAAIVDRGAGDERCRLPVLRARHPRRLGAGAAGPGQRGRSGPDAGLRRALGALPAHAR